MTAGTRRGRDPARESEARPARLISRDPPAARAPAPLPAFSIYSGPRRRCGLAIRRAPAGRARVWCEAGLWAASRRPPPCLPCRSRSGRRRRRPAARRSVRNAARRRCGSCAPARHRRRRAVAVAAARCRGRRCRRFRNNSCALSLPRSGAAPAQPPLHPAAGSHLRRRRSGSGLRRCRPLLPRQRPPRQRPPPQRPRRARCELWRRRGASRI